ncbi:MAG: S-adenosylmethionine:tRNA ribosyltransferase-isomerase [Bacteroidetes bacterium]|nr:S-adenosylmethionine:tRNA ribosyltransferase-isomerase [Bacteroidota bacterium]
MIDIENILIEDYTYDLPANQIADFPCSTRDQSKLLISKKGIISESKFFNIVDFLPKNSFLVFNDTKVIYSRFIFHKETGAEIEIFCLEPHHPSELQISFQQNKVCQWKCLIGNSKKWKEGKLNAKITINGIENILSVQKLEQIEEAFIVEFSWDNSEICFSDILEAGGSVPLPPYIHRKAVDSDKLRYQTIYANQKGSVAAPTAGLHFTQDVFKNLEKENIEFDYLSLHVGAGTFKPVSSIKIKDHLMHAEKICITSSLIKKLINQIEKNIIAVGTTSVRSLESIYWFGLKVILNNFSKTEAIISQWDPYKEEFSKMDISSKDSLLAVLKYLELNNLTELNASTQIIIVPGYRFRIVKAIITNFHQPQSTLLLLIAALIGENWRTAYKFALENDFRFLSYGDSCLLIP